MTSHPMQNTTTSAAHDFLDLVDRLELAFWIGLLATLYLVRGVFRPITRLMGKSPEPASYGDLELVRDNPDPLTDVVGILHS